MGKNERFHQTLFRWLDKQPLVSTYEQLQEQVDRFDLIYNTERPHQGSPGRITPQQAWDATPVAEAPRSAPAPAAAEVPGTDGAEVEQPLIQDRASFVVYKNGTVAIRGARYMLGSARSPDCSCGVGL